METSDPLSPRMKACALVGRFLQEWAFMEFSMRKVIQKAMKLDSTQTLILYKNLKFGDKVAVLASISALTTFIDPTKRAKYKKLFDDLFQYATTRNMVAHDAFYETDDGSVSFFVVKARGEVRLPETVWSETRFYEEYDKINTYRKEISDLADFVDAAEYRKALANALQGPQPTAGLFGLGSLGFPNLQLPSLLGSSPQPSNPETDQKTDPEQSEKGGQTRAIES